MSDPKSYLAKRFNKFSNLIRDDKFIDYIEYALGLRGIGKTKEFDAIGGRNVTVTVLQDTESKRAARFDAIESDVPEGSLTPSISSLEKGLTRAIGAITVTGFFKRKSYELKSVVFQELAITDYTESDLDSLALAIDDQENISTTNSLALGQEDTLAGKMTITDKFDQVVEVNANISRPSRWYYGVSDSADLSAIDITNSFVVSNLGNMASEITFNVGNGKYIWIANVDEMVIKDLSLGINLIEATATRNISPVAGYNKDYKIVRTGLYSGGEVTLKVEKK